MKDSTLFVITKAKDLCSYVFVITDKSPKKFRFTFVSRMQNLSLDIVEYLFRANDVYVGENTDKQDIYLRASLQQKALTDLRLLNYLGMLAMEQACILPKQYEQIAKLSAETFALLLKWKKATLKQG